MTGLSWGDSALPVPGPVHGRYPIKPLPEHRQNFTWAWFSQWLKAPATPARVGQRRWLALVHDAVVRWSFKDDVTRHADLLALRADLAMRGFQADLVAEAMGAVGSVMQRQRGWQLHDAQWLAARWMLDGRLIEMATGEGKSAVVALASSVAALAHVPVHAMTANDYLARRDLQSWSALYDALGLRAACVTASTDTAGRQQAYAQDIVHVTAREVVFDHLRDQAAMASGALHQVVLRGLCMAVLDEADSILIDEACTPLILSQPVQAGRDRPQRMAMFLAQQLLQGHHFKVSGGSQARLSPAGEERLQDLVKGQQGPWRLARYRHEQVELALCALHVLKRDVDYLVQDDEVVIVDGITGRQAVGRAWSRGLHQMVCLKEKLPLPPDTETLNQTTYQTFFPRYHRLCGLSGTLWEERAELLALYGLPVWRAPLRQPSLRQDLGWRLWPSAEAQRQAVMASARQRAQAGQAVLIGTDSVEASEALSALFAQAGVPHALLNARQDSEEGQLEREVVDQAGQSGAITIATHMAGRGTDIHLAQEASAQGGLHVINTRLNPSGRIDRQLVGRAARQGQPGSFETCLSVDDATLLAGLGAWRHTLLRLMDWAPSFVRWCCAQVQRRQGAQACGQRWLGLLAQQHLRRQLRWSGKDDWL